MSAQIMLWASDQTSRKPDGWVRVGRMAVVWKVAQGGHSYKRERGWEQLPNCTSFPSLEGLLSPQCYHVARKPVWSCKVSYTRVAQEPSWEGKSVDGCRRLAGLGISPTYPKGKVVITETRWHITNQGHTEQTLGWVTMRFLQGNGRMLEENRGCFNWNYNSKGFVTWAYSLWDRKWILGLLLWVDTTS